MICCGCVCVWIDRPSDRQPGGTVNANLAEPPPKSSWYKHTSSTEELARRRDRGGARERECFRWRGCTVLAEVEGVPFTACVKNCSLWEREHERSRRNCCYGTPRLSQLVAVGETERSCEMNSTGSGRGAGPASAAAGNDALIDSGIATLERARSMDKLGQLEGEASATLW